MGNLGGEVVFMFEGEIYGEGGCCDGHLASGRFGERVLIETRFE